MQVWPYCRQGDNNLLAALLGHQPDDKEMQYVVVAGHLKQKENTLNRLSQSYFI